MTVNNEASSIITEPHPGSGLRQDLQQFFEQTTWQNRVAFLSGTRNTYNDLIDTGKRLKSAGEFGKKGLSGAGFEGSLLRQCLFAVYQVRQSELTQTGLNWLKTELPDYWNQRERIIHLLDYLASLARVSSLAPWRKDGQAAELLAGTVRNDHV